MDLKEKISQSTQYQTLPPFLDEGEAGRSKRCQTLPPFLEEGAVVVAAAARFHNQKENEP